MKVGALEFPWQAVPHALPVVVLPRIGIESNAFVADSMNGATRRAGSTASTLPGAVMNMNHTQAGSAFN
ncbi:MAG: hypothetical protein K8T20_05295 [Planctomycetes bacterium]|nr:hypothetical protein [Planctomycetota bacterium]